LSPTCGERTCFCDVLCTSSHSGHGLGAGGQQPPAVTPAVFFGLTFCKPTVAPLLTHVRVPAERHW
jgi:hypothetical protein